MADYKEESISGKRWVRAFHVACENPLNGGRRLTYLEEEAIEFGGQVVTNRLGSSIVCPYDSSGEGETFDLVHPVTGDKIGEMTEQALYLALSSHYMHKATQRDTLQAEE